MHSKLYHRPHLTVGGSSNKNIHFEPLQRCYCENSGSLASVCVMRRSYSGHVHTESNWQFNCNGNSRKLKLLRRELLVSSRQFSKVFILNELQFAATECDSIYWNISMYFHPHIKANNYIFRFYNLFCVHPFSIENFNCASKQQNSSSHQEWKTT